MRLTPEILEKIRNNDSTLHTLSLGFSSLKTKGALALAEALKTNTTLHTLNLSWNQLGPEDARALTKALKTNTTLHTLNLQSNGLWPGGARALAELLKTNTTLHTLDLSNNFIGPEGALAFAEELTTNTTLHTLNLDGNDLGPEGASALAEALKTNTTLHTLGLDDNRLGPGGAAALAEELQTNYTLLRLEGVSSPEIITYFERNYAITACLEPLLDAHDVDKLTLEDIREKIGTLTQLAPELLSETNPLPETHDLTKNYHLLIALLYSKDAQHHEVFPYLEAPFNNPQLQATADKVFAEALFHDEAFDTADEGTQRARNQYLAYQHRDEPESPIFKIAIHGVTHPGENFTLDKLHVEPEEGDAYLLAYQTLRDIAEQALQSLEDKNTPEALLLTECLKQQEYQRVTIGNFFQSPAFLATLKQNHPEHQHVQCLETRLFFENMNKTYTIPTNLEDIQPIREEAITTLNYKKVLQELPKHEPEPSLFDKLNEAKATLCQFIDAHEESNANEKGPGI